MFDPDIELAKRRFCLLINGGPHDGQDVLGSDVEYDNFQIQSVVPLTFQGNPQDKAQLGVGQSMVVQGSLCSDTTRNKEGEKPTYRLLRVL